MRGEFSWRERDLSTATDGGVRRATFEVDRSRSATSRKPRFEGSPGRDQESFYSRRDSDSGDETADTLDGSWVHSRDQSFAA